VKGIILAGGTGLRLFPLTKATNKHLLPVGKYPMIYYPIEKMVKAGITQILIVTSKEDIGAIANLLGSGLGFGVEFTYKIQEQPGGIAQALGLTENFVGHDRCVVLLGDNIFEDDIMEYVNNFTVQKSGAKILLKLVSDPQCYGVAELDGNTIVSIEEKPEYPKSNFAVTGIYMYDSEVFDIIKTLKPSGRGELEITDVNNYYIKKGSLTYDILKGWWTDAGTIPSLINATELAKDTELVF